MVVVPGLVSKPSQIAKDAVGIITTLPLLVFGLLRKVLQGLFRAAKQSDPANDLAEHLFR